MTSFRKFITSSGLLIFGGRDAESNDNLVINTKPKEILLHTSIPGSPFVVVGESPTKQDIKEAAIFCAKYSQDWRDRKGDVIVNKFFRSDMTKSKNMKAGSWNVKKQDRLKVKKADILKFEDKLQ